MIPLLEGGSLAADVSSETRFCKCFRLEIEDEHIKTMFASYYCYVQIADLC